MLRNFGHKIKLKSITHFRELNKLSYLHHVGEEPLRNLTLGQLFQNTCQTYGDVDAVISCEQNKKLKFKEVLDQADRMAAGFRKQGFTKGDRLGIWAPNLIEWYVSNLACARAGLIMVALNPGYQAREIEYCINKVRIKGLVCADKHKQQNYYEILAKIAPEITNGNNKIKSERVPSLQTIISTGDENLKGTFSYEEFLKLASKEDVEDIKKNQDCISSDDPCNIQFTSGTTGQPKAAVISHFNLVNNSYYIGKRNELNRKQHKVCVQVPLFHAFGTVITITAAINYGTTLVLPSGSHNPDKTLDAIKNEKCTIIHGTPTMYVDLIKRQIERKVDINPEIAISGGASCSPHLFKQMLDILKVKKVKSVFGLSETTAVVFQSLFDDDVYKSTSTVGHLGEHLEAKIVDEQNKLVPIGTPGELCIRGYQNMLGYWDDEAKTKEMIGSDGWLKTGDQFVLEENGYGRVVGRLKEMIIRGGENLFPKEIEDFLNTHPDIIEAHVIGLPHERLGEEVCACIRTRDNKILTVDDIKAFSKDTIAHFKIPSVIKILESFPKTTSGKIQKFKLVDQIKQL